MKKLLENFAMFLSNFLWIWGRVFFFFCIVWEYSTHRRGGGSTLKLSKFHLQNYCDQWSLYYSILKWKKWAKSFENNIMHSNFWVFQKDGDILFRALKRFYCSPSSSSNTLVNFTIQATRFMKYLQRSLNFLLLFTTTHSEFKMSFQILWFFQLTARKMRKNRPPCILFRIYLAIMVHNSAQRNLFRK